MADVQTYATHRRFDPPMHFVLLPIFLVTTGFSIWSLIKQPNLHNLWMVVLAASLLLLALKVRQYSLRVQDRLIRLEERLRFEQILPADLKARIPELTERQLVGLRFAADGEVADRVREALAEGLDGEAIKKHIKVWRPDTFRV
jgi:hypothetical protein